jgi:hypothetical protein
MLTHPPAATHALPYVVAYFFGPGVPARQSVTSVRVLADTRDDVDDTIEILFWRQSAHREKAVHPRRPVDVGEVNVDGRIQGPRPRFHAVAGSGRASSPRWRESRSPSFAPSRTVPAAHRNQ